MSNARWQTTHAQWAAAQVAKRMRIAMLRKWADKPCRWFFEDTETRCGKPCPHKYCPEHMTRYQMVLADRYAKATQVEKRAERGGKIHGGRKGTALIVERRRRRKLRGDKPKGFGKVQKPRKTKGGSKPNG